MTESPFGNISIGEIPEFIKRGKYRMSLKSANLIVGKTEDDIKFGKKFWSLTLEVSDPTSDFYTEQAQMMVNLYTSENLRQDPVTKALFIGDEPVDEQNNQWIRKGIKFYRQIARQFGFEPEEIAVGVDFNDKVGTEYMVSLYADKEGRTRISTQDPIALAKSVDDAVSDFADFQ